MKMAGHGRGRIDLASWYSNAFSLILVQYYVLGESVN